MEFAMCAESLWLRAKQEFTYLGHHLRKANGFQVEFWKPKQLLLEVLKFKAPAATSAWTSMVPQNGTPKSKEKSNPVYFRQFCLYEIITLENLQQLGRVPTGIVLRCLMGKGLGLKKWMRHIIRLIWRINWLSIGWILGKIISFAFVRKE